MPRPVAAGEWPAPNYSFRPNWPNPAPGTAGSIRTATGWSGEYASGTGTLWTARQSPDDVSYNGLAWSGDLGCFVAVPNGDGRMCRSFDGIRWLPGDNLNLANYDMVWVKELGLFVMSLAGGTGNRIATSPDGINWTRQTTPVDNLWTCIAWSPDLQLLVALAWSGTNNRAMTSPDGVNWTIQSTPSTANLNWWSVVWASGIGLFVAVAHTGTGNRVMTSPDGATWTQRTSAADSSWWSVTYSRELNLLVAVATASSGAEVMTSSNGVDWTLQSSHFRNWRTVAWIPELQMFVAGADGSGTSESCMTSPDGIVWTMRRMPASQYSVNFGYIPGHLGKISWAPELGIMVGASSIGSGSRFWSSGLGL